jgi:hypothetical protein
MRKVTVVLLLVALSMAPAFAGHQVSLWRSTSGSMVQMIGTEHMRFQIQLTTAQGQSLVYDAQWIEVRNSFGYTAQGVNYYCTYTNKGWSINVNGGPGRQYRWDFVRWISK